MSTTENATVAKTEHTLTPDQAALIINQDLKMELWLPQQEAEDQILPNSLIITQIGTRLLNDPNFVAEMDAWFQTQFTTNQGVIDVQAAPIEETGHAE